MTEIWKNIKGFENLYQVSNKGRIKSFRKSNKFFNQPFHFLTPSKNQQGYNTVTLYKENKERHKFLVHRLVAEAFIPNLQNYPCINHKDENKDNNCVDNLEWCTYQYNNAYGTAKLRAIKTKGKKVNQYSVDGIWIASYLSVGIAAKLLNISSTSIKDCCNGKCEFAHGYKWEYTNPYTKHKQ